MLSYVECGKSGRARYKRGIPGISYNCWYCPECRKKARESGELPKASRQVEGSAGCFIATVAYGTPFCYDIDILRNWRDNFLKKNNFGIHFINFYYYFSPPIANFISDKKILKFSTRLMLKPIVFILRFKYKE